MKRPLLYLSILLFGCGRISSIPITPSISPQKWLDTHPYIRIGDIILAKPGSSTIVYLLGIITIFIGVYFLRKRGHETSRTWWGISLLLWGIGTLFAGTSYQAFFYEIKCAGKSICSFTSWYEVFYMIFTVASVNAMLTAVGCSTLKESSLKKIKIYTLANFLVYLAISLTGGFLPSPFMASFELMMLFCIPNFIICFIFNFRSYRKFGDLMNKRLSMTWVYLLMVMAAYYAYLIAGYSKILWAQGIWFSANDVLHIGLILWMLYILIGVSGRIYDLPSEPA
ncbi:MAG: hypothetical protein GY754_21495 [bacterium]|nr:hypothetical protein [bacterium]